MTAQPFKTLILDFLQQGHRDKEAFLHELNESERDAIGTWERWSAKDHMAHWTFWHQYFVGKLTAILQQQEVSPREESDDQINARVFEEHQHRPFSVLHAESQRVYTELITLVEQLSEGDLTTSHRFSAISEDRPLYPAFLGSCYEHDQEHIAQYYLDHHDVVRATQIREKCVNRVMQAAVAAWVKGWFLYNLACFYALHNQLEKAAAGLQEGLTLAPDLKEHSKSDPDLAALRDQSA